MKNVKNNSIVDCLLSFFPPRLQPQSNSPRAIRRLAAICYQFVLVLVIAPICRASGVSNGTRTVTASLLEFHPSHPPLSPLSRPRIERTNYFCIESSVARKSLLSYNFSSRMNPIQFQTTRANYFTSLRNVISKKVARS